VKFADFPRLDADTRVAAARDQVSAELDGEAVILSLDQGVYYGLNTVGAFVWGLMDQARTVAELRDAVVDAYEVDPPTAERDLLELLADMAARGLVQVQPPA
jgi:DhnA family fructose-bisphosphate aldolase class Ia